MAYITVVLPKHDVTLLAGLLGLGKEIYTPYKHYNQSACTFRRFGEVEY